MILIKIFKERKLFNIFYSMNYTLYLLHITNYATYMLYGIRNKR